MPLPLTIPNSNQPLVESDGTATRPMQLFMAGVAPAINNFKVAGLPNGVRGLQATVTDGDAALAWGAAITNTGAGATSYLVWYNGSGWKVLGK
jgi:hypothetical protein